MAESKLENLTPSMRKEIDIWVAKYPPEHKESAVMPALRIAQEQNGGHITRDLMDAIAEYLEMRPISVYEVATFYSMYEHKSVGKNKISVCTNISCMLRGSEEIVAHLEKRLGIKLGETTPDGNFTIKQVECLGACAGAPMLQLGKDYHEFLTPERVDEILAKFGK